MAEPSCGARAHSSQARRSCSQQLGQRPAPRALGSVIRQGVQSDVVGPAALPIEGVQPADGAVPFEDADPLAEMGQANAGRQSRHAGADDDRVVHGGPRQDTATTSATRFPKSAASHGNRRRTRRTSRPSGSRSRVHDKWPKSQSRYRKRDNSIVVAIIFKSKEQLPLHPFRRNRLGRQKHHKPIAASERRPDLVVPLLGPNDIRLAEPHRNSHARGAYPRRESAISRSWLACDRKTSAGSIGLLLGDFADPIDYFVESLLGRIRDRRDSSSAESMARPHRLQT